MRVARNTWTKQLQDIGIDKLHKMRVECGSWRKLSKYLNISYSALVGFVNQNIIDSKKCIDINLLLDADTKYVSIRDILNKIGCSQEILKKSFKYHNLPYPSFRGKYTCNEDFFDIKNLDEKSMYWAGLLAADGNLRITNNSYCLKLELSQKDKAHIENFKNDIRSDGRIIDSKKKASKLLKNNKSIKEWYYYSYLIITSKRIFNDLGKFGILPRKTYTYTMPQWLIDHPLVHHFIRGYMDADGSYTINKRKNKEVSLHISLPGACPAVKQIWGIIKNKCDVEYGNFIETSILKKDKPFYQFLFNGHKDNVNIVNFLYKDSETFLVRKKERADKANYFLQMSSKYFFDPVELQKLYNELGSLNAVSKKLGCNRTTIGKYMDKFGLFYKKMPQMNRKKHENNITKNLS